MDFLYLIAAAVLGGGISGCIVASELARRRYLTGGYTPTSDEAAVKLHPVETPLYDQRRAAGIGPVAASLLGVPPGPELPALANIEEVHAYFNTRYKSFCRDLVDEINRTVRGTDIRHVDVALHLQTVEWTDQLSDGFRMQLSETELTLEITR